MHSHTKNANSRTSCTSALHVTLHCLKTPTNAVSPQATPSSFVCVCQTSTMAGPLQVVLNVYDLHDSNRMLYSLGVGFFHTGVEINGYEFSYSNSGVVRTRPRLPEFGEFRERIAIGVYNGGMNGVYTVISDLRNASFQPGVYHPTNRNCNHFSDAFCLALVGQHIPSWVNRAANIGSRVGVGPQTGAPTESSGPKEVFAAPGKVRAPAAPVTELRDDTTLKATSSSTQQTASGQTKTVGTPEPPAASSIFNWFGWGASSTSDTTGGRQAGTAATPAPRPVKPAPPAAKKELTEKQKELLAKMKK
jgi:hypothetical protein